MKFDDFAYVYVFTFQEYPKGVLKLKTSIKSKYY